MILGIDVGNTDTVAALIDEDGVVQKDHRYPTKKNETDLYHREHLRYFVEAEMPHGIIISSVVPEINGYLKQACICIADKRPVFVSAGLQTLLTVKYDDPDKLGADLITGAVGAVSKYGTPIIVVDIGTATTFSVINDDNEYLGGLIAPGPHISMKALASMTSLLPETELIVTDKVIGTNTADCIRIGTLTAHAAMIDGMIERVCETLSATDITIVATGGRAEDITHMCSHKVIYDRDLLFYGLYKLYSNLNNGIK